MKAKPLTFVIPLLVLLATATTVAALEAHRTPDWQMALNQYIAQGTLSGRPAYMLQVVRAAHPEQFAPDMGYPVSDDWQWQIERLPQPPHELYCVLLRQPGAPAPGPAGDAPSQIVYVGYLSDALYRTGWVVYAGPRSPFPPELLGELAALGCDLERLSP